MQNKDEITRMILDVGLFSDLRGNIYGEMYEPFLRPEGMWQHPEELSNLLIFLSDKKINNFLNIGTFNAVTFNFIADYLSQSRNIRCITIDPYDHMPIKKDGYEYVTGTSEDFILDSFDLVFIDGDHSYEGVKKDWENVGVKAKIVVFHDIADEWIRELDGGVGRFWDELKSSESFETIEFVHPLDPGYPRVMGIGVVKVVQ